MNFRELQHSSNYRKYKKYKSKYQKLQHQLQQLHQLHGGIKGLSMDRDITDTNYLLNYYLFKRILPPATFETLTNPTTRPVERQELVRTAVATQAGVVSDYQKTSDLFNGLDANTTMLMVIDMQNDFIDRPFLGATGTEISENVRIGAFAVSNGGSMVKDLMGFLNTYDDKFKHIVFTRDVHPCGHCSFASGGGIFPDHCVNTTPGSGLITEIQDFLKDPSRASQLGNTPDKKYQVIFKGCHHDADSFGALSYQADEYLTKRQVGNCCKDLSLEICASKTGGFYSKINDGTVLQDGFNALDNLDKPFKIPGSIENVFVVGLAGDYCVCDTAVNIRNGDRRPNVNVIYELTRNAFIPYGKEELFSADLHKIKDTDQPNKDLTKYVFTMDGPKYRNVSSKQLDDITASNYSNYWHFLTDPKELLERYQSAGVKLNINVDTQVGEGSVFNQLTEASS
jgi:nicotinamidase-related amidase